MTALTALNADLHSHSTISDGVFSPAVLAERASRNGVALWSLTDHDEVRGIAEAREAAQDLRMAFIPGVEISVTWAGKTVHVVGLNVDETHPDLLAGLERTRSGRDQRGQQIATALERLCGVRDAYAGALHLADNPDLLSRSHFARYLVEQGVCAHTQEAFDRFLADGKPAFIAHQWARLEDAVGWIKKTGGVAVLAHPGRYQYDDLAFSALFDAFQACGGCGVEVVTGSHAPHQYEIFAALARRRNLLASRGSDFHAPDDQGVELGQLPPLPAHLTPVWSLWKDSLA